MSDEEKPRLTIEQARAIIDKLVPHLPGSPVLQRPITLTKRELELINSMCAIASAQAWGEGDYCEWGNAEIKHFNSLRDKTHALLAEADLGPAVAQAMKRFHKRLREIEAAKVKEGEK